MNRLDIAASAVPASAPEAQVAMPSLAESRRRLLEAIGEAPQMVFVRPFGNTGDEMIWAGARELLSGHIHREISVNDIAHESGELAVISGGGAWSPAYNEYMPEVLAIAERRFDRVVVFPSTFDTSVERVRSALSRSRATVFAREPVSLARIAGLCDARLAHDTAFFMELPEDVPPGSGTLRAFRVDREANPAIKLSPDNVDISEASGSLDEWIQTIAAHERVETNRAHVMIAAARMGKHVSYAPGIYFKVESIAKSCLADDDVQPLPGIAKRPGVETTTEHRGYLVQLGDSVEPAPGALDALADALDAHPQAMAASPTLSTGDGTAQACGGWVLAGETDLRVEPGSADFGPPVATGWVQADAAMFRREAFDAAPRSIFSDPGVRDIDWALRFAESGAGGMIGVPSARFTVSPSRLPELGDSIEFRAVRMNLLADHAALLGAHSRLMPEQLLELMPELATPDGSLDASRARLLLALIDARGTDWALMEWMNGGLNPLIGERLARLEARSVTLDAIESGGWWRMRSRLAPLLKLFSGRR